MGILELPARKTRLVQAIDHYLRVFRDAPCVAFQALPKRARQVLAIGIYAAVPLCIVAVLVFMERLTPWFTPVMGAAMFAASLVAIFGGMPGEIRRNYRSKTAPRTYRWLLAGGFAAYLLRSVYTGSIGDVLTMAAAAPGAVGTYILLVQQRIYPATRQALIPVRARPVVGMEPDGSVYMALSLCVVNQTNNVAGMIWVEPGVPFMTVEAEIGVNGATTARVVLTPDP